MRIKALIFLTIFFFYLSFSLAPGNSQADSKIIVAGDKNFPPVEYLEDNHPKGFNVELWQELSKTMGRTLEIELMPWKDAQKKVLDGEADALTLLGPTEQRRKLYDFSEPWLEFKFVFFVRTGDLTIRNINDLEGKVVGVTEGGYPRQVLESNKKITLRFIANNLEGFRLLQSNIINAVATDQWVGSFTVQKHDIEGVRIVEEPFAANMACIPVKKGNLKLLNEINIGIDKLKEDGTIQQIIDRWSPKQVVFLTKEKITRIIIILSIALSFLIIAAAVFWILSLRKQVESKTALLKESHDSLEKRVEERTSEISKINTKLQTEITERVKAEEALRDTNVQLQSLADRLEEMDENHRRRTAKELHDRTAQNLSAVSINLSMIKLLLSPEEIARVDQRLEDSQELLNDAVMHIRDVMAELHPAILDDYGLMAALRWLGDQFSERMGVHAVVTGEDLSSRLSEKKERAIFRIAQEALMNIAKHAMASEVIVALEEINGSVRLVIWDDGVGFDEEAVKGSKKPHWGLVIMKERIIAVQGKLNVESMPDKGTRIIAELRK